MKNKQKPIEITLDDHKRIFKILRRALPSYIKIGYIDSEMYGQNGEVRLFINDHDFLKCPDDVDFEKFKSWHVYSEGMTEKDFDFEADQENEEVA